jgi:hypothetical protein
LNLGVWTVQTVDPGFPNGYQPSLQIDPSGGPVIAYGRTNGAIGLATFDGTRWNRTGVASGTFMNSMQLDSHGYPHIAYYDSSSDAGLKYATWNGTKWTIQLIDQTTNENGPGQFPSLALDSHDNAFISYYESHFGDLKLATNIPEPSSGCVLTIGAFTCVLSFRRR